MPAVPGPGSAPAAAQGFQPLDVVLLVLLSLLWGTSFLFIEVAVRDLGPVWVVAGRTAVGGLLLVFVSLARRAGLPRGLWLWRRLLILGVLNNAVPWGLLAWAQQTLPSGLAGLLMAIVPTSTLLVAASVGLERITVRRMAGLLLALAGVGVIVGADLEQPGRIAAVLAVVVGTIGYAAGAVYAKKQVSGHAAPLALATGQVLCAAGVSMPAAWLFEGGPGLDRVPAAGVGAVVALGLLGTGTAFLVFYTLVERVGATNATLVTYLIPIVAVITGALALDERLGLSALAGGGLIMAGIWLAQQTPTGPRATSGAPVHRPEHPPD